MRLDELEAAFLFVGGAAPGERTVMICPKTGRTLFRSETGDVDKMPDEEVDTSAWLEVPHKNELGLGRDLVLAFVEGRLPADLDRVRSIFSRRGAYAAYKELLAARGLLDEWYEFEDTRLMTAIRDWCRAERIEITE